MKLPLTILAAVLFATRVLALDIVVPNDRTYRDCTNLRASGDELLFMHATGTARVRFEKLPPVLQAKYFDAEKVAAIQQQRASDELMARAIVVETARQKTLAADRKRETEARIAATEEETRKLRETRLATEKKNAEDKKKAAQAAVEEAAKNETKRVVERMTTIPPPANAPDLSTEEGRQKQIRMENYRSKKWVRFNSIMISPTNDGQIMKAPWGSTIHVAGDLGKAQGEGYQGYFERSGNYDYTAAGGAAARVQNWVLRASAEADILEDMKKYTALIKEMYARFGRRESYKAVGEELIELHTRLEGEGMPMGKLEFPR